MDLKEKVTEALQGALHPETIRLKEDDGIYGFVVSSQFRGVSALDRQILIDKALRNSPSRLTKAELRQVLAIAALTPAEFEAVDPTLIGGR